LKDKKNKERKILSFLETTISLLEACFDLISGSSLHMKIQFMGGKITENLGFKLQIPAPEGQKLFVLFTFHFQILHKKLHIFVFNHF
jgi:hypothetical protein